MWESLPPRFVPIFVGCVVYSLPGSAEQLPALDAVRPTIAAVRLNSDERVAVDGRLDEQAWQRAEPVIGFGQSDPRNGEPSTERTAIRILFDYDSLYIGAELDDSDPGGVLGKQMFRDGALDADDRFMWVLDPFNDQRSGYFFETNPAGVLGGAQLVAARNANVGTALNRAWDGIWLARVRRHDQSTQAIAASCRPVSTCGPGVPSRVVQLTRAQGGNLFDKSFSRGRQHVGKPICVDSEQHPV